MRVLRSTWCLLVLWLATSRAVGGGGRPIADPAPANGWDRHWFDYEPKARVVEEATPAPEQVDFQKRPSLAAPLREPAEKPPAAPLVAGAVEILHLRFRDHLGEDVPVLLCKPRGKTGPFPVVIAIHGVCSNKAQICGSLMDRLSARGFAVLALDLPLHGERPGDPRDLMEKPDFIKGAMLCRQAVIDIRQCIDLAEKRRDLDTRGGVMLAGYSLGALIASVAGPADDRVKELLLLAGGSPDFPPAAMVLPGLRALVPELAMPHFAGRPVFMLNGLDDQAIHRDWADRLFKAAGSPKKQSWYSSGHELPEQALDEGIDWLVETWQKAHP